MKLIELHFGEKPYSLNADYIAAVNPNRDGAGCEVYMVGDCLNEMWNTDEEYEEVLRLIKEATKNETD